MALNDVKPRQTQIREWWVIHNTNPFFLRLMATQWSPDKLLLERWVDMFARVACYEEGTILGDNLKWAVIETQMKNYSPLWLMKNWYLPSVKKRKAGMLTRFHEIKEDKIKGRYNLELSGRITENITADYDELYEWLGVTGGVTGAPSS